MTESNTPVKNNPENPMEGKNNNCKSPPQSVTASIIPAIKNTQHHVPGMTSSSTPKNGIIPKIRVEPEPRLFFR